MCTVEQKLVAECRGIDIKLTFLEVSTDLVCLGRKLKQH